MNDELNKQASTQRTVCFASCRKLNAQVTEVKHAIVREYQDSLAGNEHMIEAAVNEAEALAWQTPYPHLFFPTLAREKAAEVTRWAARQELVRHAGFARAFAA